MFNCTTSASLSSLPPEVYWHLVRTFNLTLLPAPGDSREDRVQRNRAGMACIAALAPATIAEADLAAQFVIASEQWKHCLRLVHAPGTTPERAMKWRSQAAAMMRQSTSAMRQLLQMQAARRRGAEAVAPARNPPPPAAARAAAVPPDPAKPKPH